jgi:glycosyltransferase involved in cell wall biosynthesis
LDTIIETDFKRSRFFIIRVNTNNSISKVALITDGITPFVIGGMQRHSYNIAKYLAKSGIQVELYHCVPAETTEEQIKSVFEEDERPYIKHHLIKFPKHFPLPGHYLRENYEYSAHIYRSIRKIKDIDIIIAKGFTAWHLLKQKEKGELLPPVIIKFHGYEMFQTAFGIKEKLKQYLLKGPVQWNVLKADKVWSYGGKITQIIESLGVPKNKIVAFPACIEAEDLRDQGTVTVNDKLKFVYLGRYERRKGIEEWHQVIESQTKQSVNAEFHFIGDIPDSLRLSGQNIFYHGVVKEKKQIFALLDQMDVLVTPSFSEGMPNVILEGMARGLAVIATNVGAVSEMVNDEVGVLIHDISELNLELNKSLSYLLKLDKSVLTKLKKNAINKVNSKFIYNTSFINFIKSLKN